jgi:hypothetical protein
MKAVAGSVVVLAAAILIAAGVLANSIMLSANRVSDSGAVTVGLAGGALGIVGFAVFALGLAPERRSPRD